MVSRLISPEGHVTGVNATLQFPGEALDEVSTAANFARKIAADLEERYPHLDTYISGVTMLNNAFEESAKRDMMTLVPLMYLGVIIVMFLSIRSIAGTFATVVIIASSVATAMGLAGWLGTKDQHHRR